MSIRSVLRWSRAAAALALLSGVSHSAAQPANDSCDNAVPISLGTPVTGTTVGADANIQVTCHQDTGDVYYSLSVDSFGSYVFEATGENNPDLSLALVSGCAIPHTEYNCSSGLFSGPRIETTLFAGQNLFIRVGSSAGQAFTLRANFAPPPANDECTGATPLQLGTPLSSNNVSATTTLALPNAGVVCSTIAPGAEGGADVFFSFTPTQDGFYDFSTCGSELDTIVSVHSACPVSAANLLRCNDNAPPSRCELPFDDNSSYVSGVQMTAGNTYYVRVAGVRFEDGMGGLGESQRGSFDILVQPGSPPVIPTNDDCTNAEVILLYAVVQGSTIHATSSVPGVCGSDDFIDVWYSFTSPLTDRRPFRFELVDGDFNASATLSAYDACNGNVIACYASNPFTASEMLLWVVLDPNQTIKLRIAGRGNTQDDFTLISSISGAPGATNNTCASAQTIAVGQTITADTTTTGTGEPSECATADIYPLWYRFTAPSTGYYRFATDFPVDPKSFDRTVLSVYSACGAPSLACTLQGDSFSTNPAAGALVARLNAGETHVFRVGYLAPRRGVMDVTVTGPLPAPPPVTNDTCTTAQVIASMPFEASVNVTLATPDQDVCEFEGAPSVATPAGIWYRFTTGPAERVFLATVGTHTIHAARATVFRGSCGSLTQVHCSNGLPSDSAIHLAPNTSYSILVSLNDETPFDEVPYGATVEINFIAPTAPANDHCSSAQRVTSSSSISVNTLSADADAPQPSCIGQAGVFNNAVWYSLTPSTAGTLTVHGEAPDLGFYSPGGALFSGSCGDLAEIACDSPMNDFLTFEFDFTAELQAGQTYHLAVGAWGGHSGGDTDITIDYTGELGCAADFNSDGVANSQDFFDYLTAFFALNPSADFNADGVVNSQDFFDFLTAFFGVC